MNYTEEELEEAKEYLKERLRNVRSMSADVEALLEVYAANLLAALFRHASDEEIQQIIDELIQQLIDDCETLAVDKHDRREEILAYMNGERHGDTFRGRVKKRVDTFFNEVLVTFTAGVLLGTEERALLEAITKNLKLPWENEVLREAREKQAKGEISSEYDFNEPHYGKGNATSSLMALDRLFGFAISDAWNFWKWIDKKDKGAVGYYVLRGSSYNCPICDEHTHTFYPIEDRDNLPPFHLSCVCYPVYSSVNRL